MGPPWPLMKDLRFHNVIFTESFINDNKRDLQKRNNPLLSISLSAESLCTSLRLAEILELRKAYIICVA